MKVIGALFGRASTDFTRIVAAIDDASWEKATVCSVSVRELVTHVVAGNEFAVRLLAGAAADESRVDSDNIRLGVVPTEQVAASCAAQTEAFARGDPSRLLHHPNGDIDYDTFVLLRLGELVVHGWDISSAAKLDTALDQDVVQELWRRVNPNRERLRAMGSYGQGSSDPLGPDAPTLERLLDAFGRRVR